MSVVIGPGFRGPRTRALLLVAVTLLVLGGLAYAGTLLAADDASSAGGAVTLRVTGPDAAIWNGTVTIPANGTSLDALLAAADAGDFPVETRTYSYGTYVVAIDGHAAHGSTGWVFEANGVFADRAADRYRLDDGDSVHWYWSEA